MDVQEILELIPESRREKSKEIITHAYNFALQAHNDQKRYSGEPYFTHVFETAKYLASYDMDAPTIAAGLLHDTLEDTPVTEEDFEKEFGKEILELVRGVTKLGKIRYTKNTRHIESLRKFLMAISQDYRILIIKLADRLHNLKTLGHVPEEKRQRIALESIEVYAPLADRLGIGKLKGEIEDLAFPFAYPADHQMIEKIFQEKESVIKSSLENVYQKLKSELERHPIKVHNVDYRIKHQYSFWKKLQKYEMNTDKIYDLVALRVIVETVEECYAVLGIIHSNWMPLPGRIKDFIALPKLNGYQSIHTTIFTGEGGIVEIQIRTKAMHNRAEFGIASHALYKESSIRGIDDPKFKWVKEFEHLNEEKVEPTDFLKNLKTELFNDRIFVFTPKGDIIDLPKGSTPIDFAYAVHTKIGDMASGARVNGKFLSLDTEIHSGEIVEIVTKKDSTPKSKWLDFAKTTLAKKRIKSYINEHKEAGILQRFFPKKIRE